MTNQEHNSAGCAKLSGFQNIPKVFSWSPGGCISSPQGFSVFLCLLALSSLPQKTDENLIKRFQNMKMFPVQNDSKKFCWCRRKLVKTD